MSSLSTSGVFSSRVDYFCLVCESRLRDEADAAAHVAKPVHTKNFLTTEYFGNQQECVRKIKKWYLCELCNVLLPTAARVRLHVVEARHLEHRDALAVQRRAGRVLAFASVQLDDRAWNGILEDTCAICNTEFDDEHIHRNETTHILKLIQSKIEYDENQNLYRRVDDNTIHCITCNKLIAFNSIDVHSNDDEHKNLYQSCCDETFNSDEDKIEIETENAVSTHIEKSENVDDKNDIINKKEHSGIDNEKNDIKQNEEQIIKILDDVTIDIDEKSNSNSEIEDILSSIENFNRNDININIELQTATCKKCDKHLDFQVKTIKEHILEHEINKDGDDSDTTEEFTEEMQNGKTSPTTVQEKQVLKKVKAKKIKENSFNYETKQFANKNDMTYFDNEDKVYCNKCKVNIPTSLKCLQEHVAGAAHLKAINKQHLEVALYNNDESDKEQTNKIAAEDFISNTVFLDGIFKCVVINDKICISLLSFNLMVEENNKLKCLICEQKVFTHDFDAHRQQYRHNKTASESFVLSDHLNEFIREIKPQHFHCGYCNSVHSPYSAMATHIQSDDHRESRSSGHIRLQRLMPEIIQHRREQQFNRMMHVFGFMFGANRRQFSDSDSD
ncbi:hypothetical protein RR46_01166 [Papilio xuthus]|uniref:C2H2-type domain-containing protein n=1 Tax=Papilio xuthus TaxID=66420 RepID=A0A0N0PA73_PAPXU|nr:hypothetical protein RR46_01166 [Papilio xuthus]